MSEDLPLLILFGSQSGNSEDLALTASKLSSKYGLTPITKGMDEITLSDISSNQRILIFCSTWGEGEMPDNAEDLWQTASSDAAPSLEGCHFAVCGLGDTSYDLFCQSGKDWDSWFEKQGANRLVARLDCDVEYEDPAAAFTLEALSKFAAVNSSGVFEENKVGVPSLEPEPETLEESISAPSGLAADNGDLEVFLSAGDRTLNVFFGSQSGNSEELAAKLAKNASQYGLNGVVHDMDGFDINTMASMKRVAIVCSTWGEGEMPDNAEALWQAAASNGAPRMDGMSFSVLALGDTSYELFCQSGKDWDKRLEELGASRVVERVDCDVDYEAPASVWAEESLTMLSAIDDSGNLHEELIDAIRDLVTGGVAVVDGEDGFTIPDLLAEEIEVELSVFRYDPHERTSGTDTWLCSLKGHTTLLDALRSIQRTHDGSLCFTDGSSHDPCTALLVNGRVTLPGSTRIDCLSNGRPGPVMLTIEPLPGYDVLRDLCVDFDSLLKKRESASVWHVSKTREAVKSEQGIAIGPMDASKASELHAMSNHAGPQVIHACSDAVAYADTYLGPSVCLDLWARRCDPRTSDKRINAIDATLAGTDTILAETDIAPFGRQPLAGRDIQAALSSARTRALEVNGFNGRHGKHVWWYAWTLKSSGKVNDTVLYRQVLGPLGLLSNLSSGVTARMVTGFTRTGGKMVNDILALVAPPAGLGKMPRQFNKRVDNHHEVVSIFNSLDRRF